MIDLSKMRKLSGHTRMIGRAPSGPASDAIEDMIDEIERLQSHVFDLSSRGYGLRQRVVDYLNSTADKDTLRQAFIEWETASGPRFLFVNDPRVENLTTDELEPKF